MFGGIQDTRNLRVNDLVSHPGPYWPPWSSLAPMVLTGPHGLHWLPWSSLTPMVLSDPHCPYWPPLSSLALMIFTDPHGPQWPPWPSLALMILTDPMICLAPLLIFFSPDSRPGPSALLGCHFYWELGICIRLFVPRFPIGVDNST